MHSGLDESMENIDHLAQWTVFLSTLRSGDAEVRWRYSWQCLDPPHPSPLHPRGTAVPLHGHNLSCPPLHSALYFPACPPPRPHPRVQLFLSIYYSGMAAACIMTANWMLAGYCILSGLLFMVLSFGDCFF